MRQRRERKTCDDFEFLRPKIPHAVRPRFIREAGDVEPTVAVEVPNPGAIVGPGQVARIDAEFFRHIGELQRTVLGYGAAEQHRVRRAVMRGQQIEDAVIVEVESSQPPRPPAVTFAGASLARHLLAVPSLESARDPVLLAGHTFKTNRRFLARGFDRHQYAEQGKHPLRHDRLPLQH